MVNHIVHDTGEFELNGHKGYSVYNETTGTHSIMCSTCFDPSPSYPTRPTRIDNWSEHRGRGPRPDAWERHADPMSYAYGLTVRQPYATALAEGWKPIENRDRRVRVGITVLIHSGLEWQLGGAAAYTRAGCVLMPTSPRGVILAVGRIDSVCGDSRLFERVVCDCGRWAEPGQYHWHFTDVRKLPDPVAAKGMPGLWKPTTDVLEAVKEQLR